jgi:phosphogluconate dehydratase
MTKLHPKIAEVTERIRQRSADPRAAYLEMIRSRRPKGFARQRLTEGNLAHASAGCAVIEKDPAARRRLAQYRHHHRL